MTKRKQSPKSIPRVVLDAPRPLDASAAAHRSYPRAADLAASPAWAEWLETAFRAVLLPAGVAGALSLAACGLGQGQGANGPDPCPVPVEPVHTAGEPPSVEPNAPPTTPGAPIPGAPVGPSSGASLTPTAPAIPPPEPMHMPGEAPPVAVSPTPAPTPPPAPVPPPAHPPQIRGRVASTTPE